MHLLNTPLELLARRTLPMALAAALCCASTPAAGARLAASEPAGGGTTATVRIPIGNADLDIDDTDVDQKIGVGFVDGVRSGAETCYTEALRSDPNQKGEIAFVVSRRKRAPPWSGPIRLPISCASPRRS